MSLYESLMVMIGFGSLIVAIIALAYTFTKKK